MKPWIPHDYQKRGLKFMVEQACAGIFWDPGLGKSSVSFAAFKVLRAKNYVNRMLVIAPLRPCYSVWPQEAEKWKEFSDLKVAVLHGPHKLERLKDPTVDVHVINPEGLEWLFKTASRASPTDEWPWGMLVVDESTRFKHTRTKRFKTLKPWLKMFRRRYILTGTPAPNGLLDLFGQVFLLDGGHALGQFITHYKATYFDNPDKQGWTWVPRHGAQQEIYKKLEPLVMRMSAEDYLKMPSLLTNEIVVELPPAARRVYDQMENLMVAQIGAKTITAANAAAVAGKCRQVAGGGVYSGVEGRVWEPIHEAKVDALEELVEELQGQPLLVAYEFDHERERLQTRFPGTPYIGGGVSVNDFRRIEQAWNRGELPLLFAQPQSVAHGLNLFSGGHHIAFFTTTWNLEDHDQFIRRVYRQGQDKPVTVHYINAKDTIDEMVVKLLAKKDRTQKALLNALKIYTEERRS